MLASFKRVSELTIGDLMVGEEGGTSKIQNIKPSEIMSDRWIVTTEHTTMLLRSDQKVIIKAES